MWPEIVKHLTEFPSAVLTGVDGEGYPFSARCIPRPDSAQQTLRVQLPPGSPVQPGPASLLCHKHDEQLWHLKSFLVRGVLLQDGENWILRLSQFVPGMGIGGLPALLRFAISMRRIAKRYLESRGLTRPKIPWHEINRIKAEVRRRN